MSVADEFEHAVMARMQKEHPLSVSRSNSRTRDVGFPSASVLFVGFCLGTIAAKVACVHVQ